MDAFALILALLMLLVGAVAGAAAAYLFLRRRNHALEEDFDAVSARLSEVSAQFAAADAERRLLAAQNRELGESRSQDGSVLRALAPVAEKLTAVQQQVALLERDRLEQYGQLAQQLQEARLSDAQLIRSTHALESALRSNSARGQWGEVQLRRVVEAAGMLRARGFPGAGPQRRRGLQRPPGPRGPAARGEAAGGGRQGAAVLLPGGPGARCRRAARRAARSRTAQQALLAAHAKALRPTWTR